MDDDLILSENPNIKASDGLYTFWFTTKEQDYWPVTYSMLWKEWRLWERNPTGYHVTNLILHLVESLLIWIILRKLCIPGAFLAALLFAVHPVNVESVAWISSRKNLLAMLFFLLSILWYLKSLSRFSPFSPTSHSYYYWLSLAAFLLAMLSKGSVAVLPVLLLGIVWWLRPVKWWDLLHILPFFMVAVILTGVNIWFQTHGDPEEVFRTASFIERLLSAGVAVWFYLYKAILPFDLAFVYPMWPIVVDNMLWWLPLLAALAVTVLLWWYRKSWSRPFLFAWGFFCVALAPVLGFTDIGYMRFSLVADRYQHIAIIAVIALLSALWSVWYRQAQRTERRAAIAIAVVTVSALVFLTCEQSKYYHDEVTLYRFALKKNPECWMIHNNLGFILAQAGHETEALEHFQQSVQWNPDYPISRDNLGNLLFRAGRFEEAEQHLHEALRKKSKYPEAHYNLGNVLLKLDRLPEALDNFQKAVEDDPDYFDAHYVLGLALLGTKRNKEAIEHFQHLLRLRPKYADAYFKIALAYAGHAPILRGYQLCFKGHWHCQNARADGPNQTDGRLVELLPRSLNRLPENSSSSKSDIMLP